MARGDRVRSPAAVRFGTVLIVLAVLLAAWQAPLVYRGIDWYRLKPTGWVLEDLRSRGPGRSRLAADELIRRDNAGSLSAARRLELADAALAEQAAPTPSALARPLVDWLGQAVLDGTVADARRQKFLEQAVRLNFVLRPTVVLGDPIPYRFEEIGRTPGGGDWRYQVEHKGTKLDGVVVEQGGSSGGGSGIGSAGSMSGRVPCATPGRHEVAFTARVRIFHGAEAADAPPATLMHERDVALLASVDVLPQAPPGYVPLVDDAKLGPRIGDSIRVVRFARRPGGWVSYTLGITSVPADVAFDVVARVDGKEYPLGTLTAKRGATFQLNGGAGGFGAPADAAKADLVLRSSQKVARSTVDLTQIWGGELVLPDVPVTEARQ